MTTSADESKIRSELDHKKADDMQTVATPLPEVHSGQRGAVFDARTRLIVKLVGVSIVLLAVLLVVVLTSSPTGAAVVAAIATVAGVAATIALASLLFAGQPHSQ